MTIETKYNIGDIVTIVPHKRKTPVEGKIDAIHTIVDRYYKSDVRRIITYTIRYDNKVGMTQYEQFHEENL